MLVNNAGITRDMTFKKMDKANWDAVMKTNLDSCFNMTKQVCDGMVDRGWGRIINISSVNGQKGAFGQTNYSAAKAGMHGFTKALALEVARKGVTVNTISPGYIGTKMVMAIPQEVLDSQDHPADPDGPPGQARGGRRAGRLPRRATRRRSSPAPTSRSTAASTCSDRWPAPRRDALPVRAVRAAWTAARAGGAIRPPFVRPARAGEKNPDLAIGVRLYLLGGG